MSTTTTTAADEQNTKASMISTSSQDQPITPQISLAGEMTTSVGNPTASGSVALGQSRESKRPTDTLLSAPKNSHERLKRELKDNADAAESRHNEREARRLERAQRKEGSK
jgi:hypothetical protein